MATAARPFADTNVLLYLLSADDAKADRAEALLAAGVTVSVQVLNEFANVARRKLAMPWPEIAEVLHLVRQRCVVRALTIEVHERALTLVQRHDPGMVRRLDRGCRAGRRMHDALQRRHAPRPARRRHDDDPQSVRVGRW